MITLIAFAAGFAFGWNRASKRGGNRLDKLQYGFGHAVAFALLTLLIVTLADRTGLV